MVTEKGFWLAESSSGAEGVWTVTLGSRGGTFPRVMEAGGRDRDAPDGASWAGRGLGGSVLFPAGEVPVGHQVEGAGVREEPGCPQEGLGEGRARGGDQEPSANRWCFQGEAWGAAGRGEGQGPGDVPIKEVREGDGSRGAQ